MPRVVKRQSTVSKKTVAKPKKREGSVLEWADGETNTSVKVLSVGPSKTGKTFFACSWPKPIIINTDKGLSTIRESHVPFFTIHRMTDEDVESDNLCSYRDVLSIMMSLKTKKGTYWDMLSEANYVPETLVIDSLSALSDIMEAEILYRNPPTEKGNKRAGALFLQDYNLIQNRMLLLIDKAKELNLNLVCTAGINVVQDDQQRRFEAPMVSGNKLGPKVAHAFDDVYLHYYDGKEKAWFLSPEQTRSFSFSGTRYKIPMEPVKNPVYKKMEKYYKVKK